MTATQRNDMAQMSPVTPIKIHSTPTGLSDSDSDILKRYRSSEVRSRKSDKVAPTPITTYRSDGNLKLVQDHRGAFILSHINHAGQRAIRVIFPPHAFAHASASFDRASLFLREINRNPNTHAKTQIMIGGHSICRKASSEGRVQRTQQQRDIARDNRRRALAKTRAKMAAEGRVPRGTMRAKRDDKSSRDTMTQGS